MARRSDTATVAEVADSVARRSDTATVAEVADSVARRSDTATVAEVADSVARRSDTATVAEVADSVARRSDTATVAEVADSVAGRNGAAPGRSHRPWRDVLGQVASDLTSRVVFAVTFVVVGFFYSLLLPYAYTQRFTFANWSYLDARYIVFTLAFAVGMGWLVTFQVHAVRQVIRNSGSERAGGRTGPLGVVAAVVSFLPSLLCCSPIIPTLVGIIPVSAATRLHTTGRMTYFFATKENLILLGALALLALSGLWSLRTVARASCLDGECAP